MWPFKKKRDVDYSKLTKEKLPSQEEIDKMDSEFRDESGEIVTRLLKKKKKL